MRQLRESPFGSHAAMARTKVSLGGALVQMRWMGWGVVAVAMLGCTGSGSGDKGGASPPPKSSGVVWEVDSASNRATAPGAMVAFANGLHVVVIDGDDIYAGMTKLATEPAPNGGRSVKLSNGETATFTPAGVELNLTFSSGESVRMHPRTTSSGAGS